MLIAGERFGYPHGFGAAARVGAYARGLQENGAVVHVVSMLTPSPGGAGPNQATAGVHDGVSFEYACGTRARAPSFLGRRWLELRVPMGLWRAARRFLGPSAGPKAIIAYTDQPLWAAFLALLARVEGACCVVEICERPFVYERSPVKRIVKLFLQDALAYRMVDGFIAISTELQSYVEHHAPPGARVILVPILVAVSDFKGGPLPAGGGPRQVLYVGDLRHEREVFDLMDSFALVVPGRPDVQLTLVGRAPPRQEARITGHAAGLGLEGRVVLTGHVERQRLPAVLSAASVLVLLRRDAAFSQAGFPTKLGEYLATGRPVVVTAIGDIPRYLTDGLDAYLVPPGDPVRFAERLSYVLDHESEALAVGAQGREVASQRFDCRRHGERLAAFICGLRDREDVVAAGQRTGGCDDV